ncbi:MAG: deoxynucleoside kinase [Chitinophagaceae bacterium]|nr:deoxynucleoside kinase [Chitinophagaceae bacterium]
MDNTPSYRKKHIAISGNIGSGKTTLTKVLAETFGWLPQYEQIESNPYLGDFYQDKQRWAFNLQVYFLNNRLEQIKKIQKHPTTVIQDRTIYEDAFIFAKSLNFIGHLSDRDYQNYLKLYESMMELVTLPDLLIYLKADIKKLMFQIHKRARGFEANIDESYITVLNEHYEKWISSYTGKILSIDVSHLDFVENKNDLLHTLEIIKKEL